MSHNIHIADIVFEVSLQGVLCRGASIDVDIVAAFAGCHLQVIGNASIVDEVMTHPGDANTIVIALSLEVGDGSNFCMLCEVCANKTSQHLYIRPLTSSKMKIIKFLVMI